MEQTTPPNLDTVTFKRSHFYTVLVLVAFCAGVLVGYMAWGRSGGKAVAAQPSNSDAAQPQAAAPTYRRYDIPTDGFYSIGPADAPITIVEFSDYQCPFCERWHTQVYEQLLAAYPGKIRFVYRNLPLTQIHPEAMPAAEAALCAGEQNAYWQFHERLFDNQDQLGDAFYAQVAGELGLDVAAFNDCRTSHKYQAQIQTDMDFAIGLGVQSTPTFFINGLAMVGAQPLTSFTQLIDKELAGEIPQ
jgi:protein-disulfide isomerase